MKVPDIDLLDLDRFRRQEHHEMLRRLRAEEPVAWHDIPDAKGFWNVVRHADVVTVNRDSALFSSEAEGVVGMLNPDETPDLDPAGDPRGLMMLYTDPPKHTRYRLLVNKGFTPRMIGMLEQYLAHRATVIVDNVIERGSVDFVTDVASELPLQAIAEIMGVPQEDRKLLFHWSNQLIGMDDPEFNNTEGLGAMAELYAYVNELGKQRHTDPREDIVTRLLNAEIEGDRLSELEFDMFMMLLSVAGNETTRNATAWGMLALMQHPDAYRELREDPAKLTLAIEEILRWASPVLHFRRTATADCEVGGQAIAKGRQGRHVVHLGQPRRVRLRRPVPLRHRTRSQSPHRLRRRWRPLLPGGQPGPHGAPAPVRRGHPAHARHHARRGAPVPPLELHRGDQAPARDLHPRRPGRPAGT